MAPKRIEHLLRKRRAGVSTEYLRQKLSAMQPGQKGYFYDEA